jgi:beta-N-acetylhexosaminidase
MTFSNNISGSDTRTVDKVHEIIRQLVERGEVKRERIDESFHRVMTLKKRLQLGDQLNAVKKQLSEANIEIATLQSALKTKDDEIKALQEEPQKKKKKKKKKS